MRLNHSSYIKKMIPGLRQCDLKVVDSPCSRLMKPSGRTQRGGTQGLCRAAIRSVEMGIRIPLVSKVSKTRGILIPSSWPRSEHLKSLENRGIVLAGGIIKSISTDRPNRHTNWREWVCSHSKKWNDLLWVQALRVRPQEVTHVARCFFLLCGNPGLPDRLVEIPENDMFLLILEDNAHLFGRQNWVQAITCPEAAEQKTSCHVSSLGWCPKIERMASQH